MFTTGSEDACYVSSKCYPLQCKQGTDINKLCKEGWCYCAQDIFGICAKNCETSPSKYIEFKSNYSPSCNIFWRNSIKS